VQADSSEVDGSDVMVLDELECRFKQSHLLVNQFQSRRVLFVNLQQVESTALRFCHRLVVRYDPFFNDDIRFQLGVNDALWKLTFYFMHHDVFLESGLPVLLQTRLPDFEPVQIDCLNAFILCNCFCKFDKTNFV